MTPRFIIIIDEAANMTQAQWLAALAMISKVEPPLEAHAHPDRLKQLDKAVEIKIEPPRIVDHDARACIRRPPRKGHRK